jgi:hypothetical protein
MRRAPIATMRSRALLIAAVCAALSTFACGSRTALLGALGDSVDLRDGGIAPGRDASSPRDSGPPDSEDASVIIPACGLVRSRVFVTSTMYTGDLAGAGGADDKCMARASAQRLGGLWRAWLSEASTPAPARIYAAPGGYVLLDGTVVAPSFDALVSGSLAHAIDLTELGTPITDGLTEAWTGIDLRGEGGSAGYCSDGSGNDWLSNDRAAPYAYVGHTFATDATWTAAYLQFCNRTNVRLYCFEVCN